MENYQVLDPNNCRVYVDYRENKDKVKFEYVGNSNKFSLAMKTTLHLMFKGLIFVPVFLYLLTYSLFYYHGFEPDNFIESFGLSLASVDFALATFFLFSIILSNTKAIKYMPVLNSFGYQYHQAVFNKDNTKSKQIEIPLFSNINLNYKATKDFSYYLERVEIVEHPFNLCLVKKGKTNSKRTEYLWKAIFYYSKKPKEGELKVMFK